MRRALKEPKEIWKQKPQKKKKSIRAPTEGGEFEGHLVGALGNRKHLQQSAKAGGYAWQSKPERGKPR